MIEVGEGWQQRLWMSVVALQRHETIEVIVEEVNGHDAMSALSQAMAEPAVPGPEIQEVQRRPELRTFERLEHPAEKRVIGGRPYAPDLFEAVGAINVGERAVIGGIGRA